MSVGILGTGLFVPESVITNHQLVAAGLDSSDAWIVEHSGIHTRHIAAASEATSDLATHAARAALQAAGVAESQLSTIICATSTPDHPLPSTAALVQHALGVEAGAFDLNAGCSGFAYALIVGFALQRQMRNGRVLVVGADTYSRVLDWNDRSSAFFFGDGAGAVVLGPTSEDWLLASYAGSNGAGAKDIMIPAGGSRLPATAERVAERLTRFKMCGRNVAKFVLQKFPEMVREVVNRAGVSLDDVRMVIPHQASGPLLSACAGELGLGPDRMMLNVDRYGNTASASLAIALAEATETGRLRPGDIVVLTGFGAGLSWAALCLRWGGVATQKRAA